MAKTGSSWVIVSLLGFAAQRTRFCTVGGIRDVILMRDFHLLSGVVAFAIAAFVLNLVLGQFHPGFTRISPEGATVMQPAAHTVHWLNFGGMTRSFAWISPRRSGELPEMSEPLPS